jgi:hypothetical protein
MLRRAAKGSDNPLGTFLDLLAYTLERNAAPADGDTVGPSAAVKWKVKYVASPIDPSVKVWRVDAR